MDSDGTKGCLMIVGSAVVMFLVIVLILNWIT